jgi:hypothetical protein
MFTFLDLTNKKFVSLLFITLFGYLFFRTLLVEPLLDELATLYWYIQTGKILGEDAVLDANNHVLISYIAHFLFKIFGDDFFIYRLFSFLSFPIYFFATKGIVQKLIPSKLNIIVFVALNTVHWIFDYFGFVRGYGSALAFYFLAIHLFFSWKENFSKGKLAFLLLFLLLAIVSNFSFFVPSLLLFAYSCFTYFLCCLNDKKQVYFGTIGILLCFLISCIPIYLHIQKLKESGSLWWGYKTGLWEVTGKSLAKNIFFTENDWILTLYLLCFVIILLVLLVETRKMGLKKIVQADFLVFPVLLFLSLAASVFMTKFMDVNYPMDRAAMYMVPLFIFTFGILLTRINFLKYLTFLLLWFPLSFIAKANLNTSVFSPEDRIHRAFYQQIRKLIKEDDAISSDYVSLTSFAYLNRKSENQIHAFQNSEDTLTRGEYHISWYKKVKWKDYTCVLSDPISKTKFYKRNKAYQKTKFFDTIIPKIRSKETYIPIAEINIEKFKNKQIQSYFSAQIEIPNGCNSFNLVQNVASQNTKISSSLSSRFNWYFLKKSNKKITFVNQFVQIKEKDSKITLFFVNFENNEVFVNNLKVKLFVKN